MSRPDSIRKALPGIGRFFEYFWPYVHRERVLIAGGLFALLTQTVLRLLEPWPLKFVIDEIIKADNTRAALELPVLGSLDTNTVLILAAISLVAISGFRALTSYWSKVSFAIAGNRVLTRIRSAVFQHLQLLSLDFHQRERGGDLVTRLVSDVGMVKDVTINAVMPLVASVLVITGMLVIMFWLNVSLTLVILALVPVLLATTLRLSKRIRTVARKNRKREGAMAATAAESITAIKTVQSLAISDTFNSRFTEHNNATQKQGAKVARMSAGLERAVDMLIAIGSAIALWFGARQVMAATLSPGEFLVFLFYLKRAFRPMRDFAKYSARLAKASAAAERVLDIFGSAQTVSGEKRKTPAKAVNGLIQFDDIGFCYPDGQLGIATTNLVVQPGETVLITGPSGSGKSTLLNLLLRLYEPQQGCIRLDGIDIREYALDSYRNQMSVVLQDGYLFTATVRDNIALLSPEASDQDVQRAATLANCDGFIRQLAEGYDTMVGERGASLSRGQRQRIAIARAAIRPSPILILDEPTTGLDAGNIDLIVQSMQELAAKRTTFIVSHHRLTGLPVDRVWMVENGTITESDRYSSWHTGFGQQWNEAWGVA
jgi:ATP-binding cassette, subfamily B, bacterial